MPLSLINWTRFVFFDGDKDTLLALPVMFQQANETFTGQYPFKVAEIPVQPAGLKIEKQIWTHLLDFCQNQIQKYPTSVD